MKLGQEITISDFVESKMSYISRPGNFVIARSKIPNYAVSLPSPEWMQRYFCQSASVESVEDHTKGLWSFSGYNFS